MTYNIRPLQLAILAILDNAAEYEWSIQGFGMVRLYIRKVGRLHLWDSSLRYENVSMIHNHSWDLKSTIVTGHVVNTRFVETPSGEPYHRRRLVTGYDTKMVSEVRDVYLSSLAPESYLPGNIYYQRASEIHLTNADDGTITLMERDEDEQGQADVYWPQGQEWGTARPRHVHLHDPASFDQIRPTIARAIAGLELFL